MSSERIKEYFSDIRGAIALIREWISEAGGVDVALARPLQRAAIERELIRVSEAAIRIDGVERGIAERLAPDVEWRGVGGIGNVIRHRYDKIDPEVIAAVLTGLLDGLDQGAAKAIVGLDAKA